jgi:hypothetical protein
MRVNFDSAYNVTNRQGFCILGQLEGDWGLYVSSSISTKCAGFIFSEDHAKIHEAERKLTDDFHEFLHTDAPRPLLGSVSHGHAQKDPLHEVSGGRIYPDT